MVWVKEPFYEALGRPRRILFKCTRYYFELLIVAVGILLLIVGTFLFAS